MMDYKTKMISLLTSNSYMRSSYSDVDWRMMILFLLEKNIPVENVIYILLSKHVRWSAHNCTNCEFIEYYCENRNYIQTDAFSDMGKEYLTTIEKYNFQMRSVKLKTIL